MRPDPVGRSALPVPAAGRWGDDLRRAWDLVRAVLRRGARPALLRLTGRPVADGPERFRLALEDLGLTYLKAGQFLAMRHDIVPPALRRELDRLFEQAPPLPFATVVAVIERELGRPAGELFAELEPQPMAAASVAQVHRGRIADGRRVAVKVQRPGVRRLFAADLRNLRRLAKTLDAVGAWGTLSLLEAVDQFAAYTLRELDFRLEGRTADRVRETSPEDVVVPWVDWPRTTSRVLTLELLDGVSVGEAAGLIERGDTESLDRRLPGFDAGRFLANLSFASLYQLFISGVFHGDPHPGNILILPGNRVGFVDFGIFGELSHAEQRLFARYTDSLGRGDLRAAFRAISRIYTPTGDSDPRAFRADVMRTLEAWYRASRDPAAAPGESHLGRPFDGMVTVVRRHRYHADLSYLLFWRTLIVLDAVALRLDPAFDLTERSREFFRWAAAPELAPAAAAAADGLSAGAVAASELIAAVRRWRPEERGGTPRQLAARLTRRRAAGAGSPARWLAAALGVLAAAMLAPAGAAGLAASAVTVLAGGALALGLAAGASRPRRGAPG